MKTPSIELLDKLTSLKLFVFPLIKLLILYFDGNCQRIILIPGNYV